MSASNAMRPANRADGCASLVSRITTVGDAKAGGQPVPPMNVQLIVGAPSSLSTLFPAILVSLSKFVGSLPAEAQLCISLATEKLTQVLDWTKLGGKGTERAIEAVSKLQVGPSEQSLSQALSVNSFELSFAKPGSLGSDVLVVLVMGGSCPVWSTAPERQFDDMSGAARTYRLLRPHTRVHLLAVAIDENISDDMMDQMRFHPDLGAVVLDARGRVPELHAFLSSAYKVRAAATLADVEANISCSDKMQLSLPPACRRAHFDGRSIVYRLPLTNVGQVYMFPCIADLKEASSGRVTCSVSATDRRTGQRIALDPVEWEFTQQRKPAKWATVKFVQLDWLHMLANFVKTVKFGRRPQQRPLFVLLQSMAKLALGLLTEGSKTPGQDKGSQEIKTSGETKDDVRMQTDADDSKQTEAETTGLVSDMLLFLYYAMDPTTLDMAIDLARQALEPRVTTASVKMLATQGVAPLPDAKRSQWGRWDRRESSARGMLTVVAQLDNARDQIIGKIEDTGLTIRSKKAKKPSMTEISGLLMLAKATDDKIATVLYRLPTSSFGTEFVLGSTSTDTPIPTTSTFDFGSTSAPGGTGEQWTAYRGDMDSSDDDYSVDKHGRVEFDKHRQRKMCRAARHEHDAVVRPYVMRTDQERKEEAEWNRTPPPADSQPYVPLQNIPLKNPADVDELKEKLFDLGAKPKASCPVGAEAKTRMAEADALFKEAKEDKELFTDKEIEEFARLQIKDPQGRLGKKLDEGSFDSHMETEADSKKPLFLAAAGRGRIGLPPRRHANLRPAWLTGEIDEKALAARRAAQTRHPKDLAKETVADIMRQTQSSASLSAAAWKAEAETYDARVASENEAARSKPVAQSASAAPLSPVANTTSAPPSGAAVVETTSMSVDQ